MVHYAKEYINLVQDPYRVVWWKLFNSPDASKWTNILTLVALTFSIPLSIDHVDRCFSQLKLTKTNRRVSLGEDRLDQIPCIVIESPPLDRWDPTKAVGLQSAPMSQSVYSYVSSCTYMHIMLLL